MEAIIESVDEFYSENLAQEVTRGMRESASRGFWVTSYAPFALQPGRLVQDVVAKKLPHSWSPDRRCLPRGQAHLATLPRPLNGMTDITRTLNNGGHLQPQGEALGKAPVSIRSSSTSPTRGLWSGARILHPDNARASPGGEGVPQTIVTV